MGSGHRSAGDIVGGLKKYYMSLIKTNCLLGVNNHRGTANPRADDVLARGEQVDDRSKVGERCFGIGDSGRADGIGGGSTSWRCVASINTIIACGDLRYSILLGAR